MTGEGGKRSRVAVVGCGIWGRNHVRNYAELGALGGVVDSKPDTARDVAERHGTSALTFQDALDDPGIGGIVLAVPPGRNLELGRQVLGAGKALFVEKPMALTGQEAGELRGLAAVRDLPLMVGHILRYHPAFLALLALVGEGALGPLLSITSTRLDFGRIRREEDALWALAPHDLSMILALVGAEPQTLAASGGYHTHPTIADTATVTLGFPGEVRAEIRVSWLNAFKEQRLVLVGRDAMAVLDDCEPWERKLRLVPHRITETGGRVTATRGEGRDLPVAPGEPLRAECQHFLHCMRTGARPRTDGAEGETVVRLLDRASAAMRADRPPPAREGDRTGVGNAAGGALPA